MDLPANLNLNWSEYLPKRMSEWGWFKRRGLVEDKGNVLVWGAPDVDKVGKVGDGSETKGPRRV
jgi:cytochrome c oxidase assembly factor 3